MLPSYNLSNYKHYFYNSSIIHPIINIMSSVSTEISYYLSIAIDINKKIGGNRGYEAEASSKDKFSLLKENITKDMQFIKAKLEERERKAGTDVLGINMLVKEKMEEIYSQIERLKECINQEKTNNTATKDIKMQIADQLTDKAKKLEDIVEGLGDAIKGLTGNRSNATYTDKKALLLDEGKTKNTNRVKKNRNNEPTAIEMEAMKRWEKDDQEIDDKLDDLTQRTIEWKKKVKLTGDLIDETDVKIDGLTQEVDKVNDNLFKSNKQLKGIVEKYRKPHKFCLDIVLVLVLVGLIVGCIKVAN